MDRRGIAVVTAGLCTFLNMYPPQAIMPALADSFAVPPAQVGITLTATLLAVACVAPFVGSVSDRLGRKRLIAGACFALVLPTLLIAFAGSLHTMILLRFAQGLLLPFIFAVTVGYIGDETTGVEGIRLAGAYALGTICGGFGGRFIAGIAADLGGWRSAFMVLAVITLAGASLIALLLPAERNFRPVTGGLGATLLTYREHLANRRLMATCGIGFCMLFAMVGTFTYVNLQLAGSPFFLNPAQLGFVFTVYLLGIFTAPLATRMAMRVGRLPTLLLVAGMALAGACLTLSAVLPVVIVGLAMVAGGLFVVQTLSLGFVATVPRARSTAVGLYVTCYYIGGALGGMAPAPLWRWAGWPGVVALLATAMLLIAVLAACSWRVVKPAIRGPLH